MHLAPGKWQPRSGEQAGRRESQIRDGARGSQIAAPYPEGERPGSYQFRRHPLPGDLRPQTSTTIACSLRLTPSRRFRVRFISSKIPKEISESSRGGSDPTAYGWSTFPADNLLTKYINCRVTLASKLIAWRARAIESGQMAPILCENAPRCSMQPRQVSCTCPSALPKAVDALLAVEEAALGHREV